MMQVVLFTMLGLLAFPTQLWEAKWIELAVAAFLMLVARLCPYLSECGAVNFTWNERLLVSWVGLRGVPPSCWRHFPDGNRDKCRL